MKNMFEFTDSVIFRMNFIEDRTNPVDKVVIKTTLRKEQFSCQIKCRSQTICRSCWTWEFASEVEYKLGFSLKNAMRTKICVFFFGFDGIEVKSLSQNQIEVDIRWDFYVGSFENVDHNPGCGWALLFYLLIHHKTLKYSDSLWASALILPFWWWRISSAEKCICCDRTHPKC